MEAIERERYLKERQKKIIAAEAKLIQKQQNEMNALKKKLEGNLNERLKIREQDHNKLLQRYQNVKKEIENQHKMQLLKFEKQYMNVPKNRPSTASQRSVMTSKMGASTMMKGSKMNPMSKMSGMQSMGGQPASKPSYLK